jgi:hypothetical protein
MTEAEQSELRFSRQDVHARGGRHSVDRRARPTVPDVYLEEVVVVLVLVVIDPITAGTR